MTFSITSTGVLAITAPDSTATINLGTAVASPTGSSLGGAGDFGAVTVTDNRALDPADWTATVSSTDFRNVTTGVLADTIPAGDATYTIPVVGADITGALAAATGLPLPGTTFLTDAAATGIPLANAVIGPPIGTPVVTVTGYDGDNGATWNPGIVVAVPDNAVAGTYDGTVTHSVT